MLMNDFSLISNEFEIRNPDELYEFIKDKEGFVELINKSLPLFMSFYPNAKYTLEYVDYMDGSRCDSVYCFISGDKNIKDFNLLKELSFKFAELKFQYSNLKIYYNFILR